MGLSSLPTYITSDQHFFHRKIVEYANRPYDHEAMMLKRWAHAVNDEDTILCLGDLFFGGRVAYERFRTEIAPKLPGKKYLVLGNHDKLKYDYEALGFEVVEPFSVPYRGFEVSFAHYPRFVDGRSIHLHGHLHNHPYSHGETTRYGNINVCVEATEYRPRRLIRLLNLHIAQRGRSRKYYNSKAVRHHRTKRSRRTPS